MCSYLIQNQIELVEDIQGFTKAGYRFSAKESTANELVFSEEAVIEACVALHYAVLAW